MKKKFGFVVLNYFNYEETIACIESILEIEEKNYFIVVVDNDSKNDSFDILCEKYLHIENIRIIASGNNGGYSFGNNCGIKYLKTIGIHDVIIATSDTRIVSTDILLQLEKLNVTNLGIVGPKVINVSNVDQNPLLAKINLWYILNIHASSLTSFLRHVAYKTLRFLNRNIHTQKFNAVKELRNSKVYMVHGCFLYLSSNYFEKCGFLDESLFMYGEEDLIAYNCAQHNLSVLYVPNIRIIHKESQSTPKEDDNRFFFINSKTSMKLLRKKMRFYSLLFLVLKN